MTLGLAVSLAGQQRTAGNPYNTSEDAAAGGRIFRAHCAVCHGMEGTGGRVTNLTSGRFRHGSSDQHLYDTISQGIPGTEMPGIFFNGKQLWQLVAYVRSLSQREAAAQVPGDPAKGRELFSGKGGCAMCHRIDGQGGRSAPDLSDIGATRSLEHLRESVLRPAAKVLPQHWLVEAITQGGEEVSGVRLNEDTFSIQLLDSNDRLVSLLKADLKEYAVNNKSLMPAFEGVFSEAELEDLLAYLASLRER